MTDDKTIQQILSYLSSGQVLFEHRHLKRKTAEELTAAIEVMSLSELDQLKVSTKLHLINQDNKRVVVPTISIRTIERTADTLPDLMQLLQPEAREIDFAPALWQLRTDYYAELERLQSSSCSGCAKGQLLRAYRQRFKDLTSGN